MTSRPPIALVKRGPELYITGILPRDGKPPGRDLIAVLFIGQGLPHQAYLAGLGYGPVGEGDTHELAAQALVEKLQVDTLDFPAFLLALAETAEDIAEGQHANEDEEIALEQQAALLHILAGLAAQERKAEQVASLRTALDETRYPAVRGLASQFDLHDAEISTQNLAEAMFDAGWRFQR